MKRGGKQNLVEKLSPLEPLAFDGLQYALKQKKEWAVKLTFEYLFGKPKQHIAQEIEQKINSADIDKLLEMPEQTIINKLYED